MILGKSILSMLCVGERKSERENKFLLTHSPCTTRALPNSEYISLFIFVLLAVLEK